MIFADSLRPAILVAMDSSGLSEEVARRLSTIPQTGACLTQDWVVAGLCRLMVGTAQEPKMRRQQAAGVMPASVLSPSPSKDQVWVVGGGSGADGPPPFGGAHITEVKVGLMFAVAHEGRVFFDVCTARRNVAAHYSREGYTRRHLLTDADWNRARHPSVKMGFGPPQTWPSLTYDGPDCGAHPACDFRHGWRFPFGVNQVEIETDENFFTRKMTFGTHMQLELLEPS